MRLINVENMVLEEFFGDHIPSYAILSHTWGQNHEEVHFGEIGTTSAHQKPGYQKIRYLCQQAATDGLSWAWCDTCCIDKSSSAELSESINSMFQWYQKANVCYAYLSDASATGVRESTVDQMRRSRWFTRGWTLQELIAPEKVIFYGRDWKFLGDKRSLVNYLCGITGVNFGALALPWALPSYSIATRMSWVSRRTTTRTEDQAYCMLGILGVYMPLLYGEGQNAFRRLQEELIKISDDETIFAHSGPKVLAFCPQEFSFGRDLTILKKDKSTPYSITNAGLHIHMRVLKLEVDARSTYERGVSALGILNCHHNNDKSRNRYLALPLELTGIDSTYRRAPSSLQWVDVDEATSVEYQTIFIQLQAVQISRITLLEDYDRFQYFSQVHFNGFSCVHNQRERVVRIYPKPPFEYEAVLHTFQQRNQQNESQPFGVVTFFDLVNDRAGVLVLPSLSYNRPTLDVDATFRTWKNEGQPAFGELYISGSGEKIKVTVGQKEQMKQCVWFLSIEEVQE